MTPSDKSHGMEKALNKIFHFDRSQTIKNNLCVPSPIGCGQPISDFRNEKSKKEYSISGLCQACQDTIFGTD